MKNFKKLVTYILVICLVLPIVPSDSADAKSIKLNSKSITLYAGQTKILKLKGTTKKSKWSSSKKSVATVTSKGKIKAKKKGNAVITAKLGKKSYKCKVKVKAKSVAPAKPIATSTEKPHKKPSVKPTETPTVATVADNYQKLANHIQTNGKYDSEDKYYYIDEDSDSGDVYTQIRYSLDGSFEFSVMKMKDTASDTWVNLLSLTITSPEYSHGEVAEIYMSDVTGLLYADGVVSLSTLSETNTTIIYTSTNASTTDIADALYKLGETSLLLGLINWNLLLQTSGSGLTLKDLGFTSYNM